MEQNYEKALKTIKEFIAKREEQCKHSQSACKKWKKADRKLYNNYDGMILSYMELDSLITMIEMFGVDSEEVKDIFFKED